MTYFRRYMQTDEGGGGGFEDDGEPVPFGEVFGINPDGSPYEAEEADSTPPADPAPTPAAPEAPAEAPDPAPRPGETPSEAAERIFAGKYKSVDELEKGYGEADKKLQELLRERQQWQQQQQKPEEAEPSKPLFKGNITEIQSEAQLEAWAVTDPEAAALFAMEHHDRIDQDMVDKVCNHWIASQPMKAISTITAWNAQILREEFAEQRQLADQHALGQIRDQGIDLAIKEQPLMQGYTEQLGEFIERNEPLARIVEAATSPDQLSKALQAAFFVMAGPQLSQDALTAKVAAEVKAQEKAQREAKAAAEAEAARAAVTTTTRNTGVPSTPDGDDAYGDAIRSKILNPGASR